MYGTLAAVYDWLVPDAMLSPEGSAEAYAPLLEPGSRVLDCAAGWRSASPSRASTSPHRTRARRWSSARARSHAGVDVPAEVRVWAELRGGPYDAVLCVGNSLTHAEGRRGRRLALTAMRRVLRPGGMLVLTSRNWERVRERQPGIEVAERLAERNGVAGPVIHSWEIAERWTEPHAMDVAVALLGGGGHVTTHAERLTFWPFTREMLEPICWPRACTRPRARGRPTPTAIWSPRGAETRVRPGAARPPDPAAADRAPTR